MFWIISFNPRTCDEVDEIDGDFLAYGWAVFYLDLLFVTGCCSCEQFWMD